MIDLYEPCMSDKGLRVQMHSAGSLTVLADAALLHRVIANLLDNELKHLPASCNVWINLGTSGNTATLTVEDDGPGFAPEIVSHMFEQRVKGIDSKGHGLGLAFVEAVVRAHGGSVTGSNRPGGGAQLSIHWPREQPKKVVTPHSFALVNR
jgi:signal transduction histidine kinase